jgi:hypothetical protein
MQAIGIDGIYLFRTGRVGTTPGQPTPGARTGPPALKSPTRPQVHRAATLLLGRARRRHAEVVDAGELGTDLRA